MCVSRGMGVGKKEHKTFKGAAYNAFVESEKGEELRTLTELFRMHALKKSTS